MDDKEIVSAVHGLLAGKVEQDNLELWFGPDTQLAFVDGVLRVTATSRFVQDWLRTHYRAVLEAACLEVVGKTVGIEFCVADSLSGAERIPGRSPRLLAPAADSMQAECSAVALIDSPCTVPVAGVIGAPARRAVTGQHDGKGSADGKPRDPRRGLARVGQSESNGTTQRRRFGTLDGFVVGSSNRMAHATAMMAVEKLGTMSPMLFYGPSGCGKTHLLEGIWSAANAQRRGINAVFLSAEQFTTLFVEALRGTGLPSFRRKYRGVDLLIVDDVQFLVGKRATLVELLHTIDALQRDGKQLVFSADRSPAELSQLGPELATRMAGGMACGLEQPDLQTRIGLVHQFARRLEVEFPQDVAQYIAANVTAGAREVSGAVNRVHAASRILGEPISMTLAEVSIAELMRHSAKVVRLADVERAVCDVFGLASDSLQASSRAKTVSSARMLAMFLARKHTRAGLAEVGQHFGRRSHSTVISAQKRVTDWLTQQADVDLADRRCTVDEAIRRVEQKLCAG